MLPPSTLLDPAALAAVADLQLVAREVVEGFLSGLHRDPRPGAGVEFAQYRAFQPGDDVRRVDWRAFARSDRLLIRESEVEREVTVRLILDATGSMAHPWAGPTTRGAAGTGRAGARRGSAEGDGLRKLDYARVLVAVLAYLADRQGDRLALHVARDGDIVDLPSARRGQLSRLLAFLAEVEAGGRWPPWREVAPRLVATRSHELVVVVSDLHESTSEIEELLGVFRALGHEVLVFHLLGRDELDLDLTGDVLFEDLETGETVLADAAVIRPAYRKLIAEDLARRERAFGDRGIRYRLAPLDAPYATPLREMLLTRVLLR